MQDDETIAAEPGFRRAIQLIVAARECRLLALQNTSHIARQMNRLADKRSADALALIVGAPRC